MIAQVFCGACHRASHYLHFTLTSENKMLDAMPTAWEKGGSVQPNVSTCVTWSDLERFLGVELKELSLKQHRTGCPEVEFK